MHESLIRFGSYDPLRPLQHWFSGQYQLLTTVNLSTVLLSISHATVNRFGLCFVSNVS